MPIFQGLMSLFGAVQGYILTLVPIVTGVMIGYHALMKQMAAGDPMAAESHNKGMKNVLVTGCIAEAAVGLAAWVLPYFHS